MLITLGLAWYIGAKPLCSPFSVHGPSARTCLPFTARLNQAASTPAHTQAKSCINPTPRLSITHHPRVTTIGLSYTLALNIGIHCWSKPSFAKLDQQNMVSFVARRKRPTRLLKLAALVGFDDYANKHWHVGQSASFFNITTLVLQQLEDGWREGIHDAASFKRFNDRRGQWTLKRSHHQHVVQGCSRPAQAILRRSLQLPFDESVVIWHIATDLCFYHPDAAGSHPPESVTKFREISNYMVYLFFLHPEMLIPGARKDVLIMACDDLELMFKYDDEPPLDERRLAQGIIHKHRLVPWVFTGIISPLLPKACKLAEALMEIRGVEERWKVIEGVWVEMLCYSASNCRGYLHSKSLGEGGEFLSYVWLLLAHMGMETFADRFHRPQPFDDEDDTDSDATADGGSASSPHQDDVPTAPEEITPATA
ncbi:hypothetical protein ACP70R_044793 [Stipagrostis hirtigluma subsp. patula]